MQKFFVILLFQKKMQLIDVVSINYLIAKTVAIN